MCNVTKQSKFLTIVNTIFLFNDMYKIFYVISSLSVAISTLKSRSTNENPFKKHNESK